MNEAGVRASTVPGPEAHAHNGVAMEATDRVRVTGQAPADWDGEYVVTSTSVGAPVAR